MDLKYIGHHVWGHNKDGDTKRLHSACKENADIENLQDGTILSGNLDTPAHVCRV